MKTLRFIFFVILLGFHLPSFGIASFDATQIVITLKKSSQHDSIGYNLPAELTKLLHSKIMDGSLILWDGPAKEIKISTEALTSLEQSSNTLFKSSEILNIHEIWSLSKRTLDNKTTGFSFGNMTSSGAISYGFIDYKDIASLLDKTYIPGNANGYLNTTFREAVQGKQFNYEITQFGADDFKNDPTRAFELQNQLFNNSSIKVYNPSKDVVRFKTISYEIYKNENENNEAIFSSLSAYFMENLEYFLNLGGDQTVSYLNKNPQINLTKINVTEQYKMEKGLISSEIQSIHFFVNGKYIAVDNLKTFPSIEILVKSKPFESFIQEKVYDFTITAINSQKIENMDNYEIVQKLKKGHWNRLLEH